MYQMAFSFCPDCGKVEIIFVECDWLFEEVGIVLLCSECMLKELDEMALDIPDDVYNRVMGKDDGNNG